MRPPASACLTVLVLSLARLAVVDSELVNTRLERYIDLSTHIVRHDIEIEVSNPSDTLATEYLLALPGSVSQHLAAFTVSRDGKQLPITLDRSRPDTLLLRVSVPLEAEGNALLLVALAFTGLLVPHPAKIVQNENQLVRYSDSHTMLSPYNTTTQQTTVRLASAVIESRSHHGRSTVAGPLVTYGPYKKVAGWWRPSKPLMVHFENNSPFITMREVADCFSLVHSGAKLQGSFSRFDYQRNPKAFGAAAYRSIEARLPANASEVYFYDDTGNVTTAWLSEGPGPGPSLELALRFALFGGWRIDFCTAYTLPLSTVLSVEATGRHVLTMPLSHAIQGAHTEVLDVRIHLPGGASAMELAAIPQLHDHQLARLADGESIAMLGYSPRPVLTLQVRNVVSEHNQTFTVTYSHSRVAALMPPLALVAAMAVIFFGLVAYGRIDLSLSPQSHHICAPMVERYQTLAVERNALWQGKVPESQRLATCQREIELLLGEIGQVSRHQAARVRRCEDKVAIVEEARSRAIKAKSQEAWDEYYECCDAAVRHARDLHDL